MSTVHLVVADANQEYVDLLFQYIRTSEEHHKFILKSFSTSENVTRFLDQHKGAYLLLVTPELLPPELHKKDNVMLLVEDHQPHEEYITINKFQPLNLLLSKVWAFHLEKNGLAISHQFLSKKTKIVSFYSASGGAGKTTAAINFCNQAASQDYRVFYLNLELYHSVHSLFPTEEKAEGLDTLLYYVKSRSKQLVAKIEELKQTQTFTKIDYLSPANGQEMLDLTKQDIEFLLQGFIDLGSYDFIVLDLESSLHERIVQSLQMSDLIIWVTVDDLFQVDKSKQSIEALEQIAKDDEGKIYRNTTFIVNRYTGQSYNRELYEEFAIKLELPYIPEWKNVMQSDRLWSSTPYNEAMLKLFRFISPNE